MGAEQSLMQRTKLKRKHKRYSDYLPDVEINEKTGNVKSAASDQTEKQKKKSRKRKNGITSSMPMLDQVDKEVDNPYEWVSYDAPSRPDGYEEVKAERKEKLNAMLKELDYCVRTIVNFQAEIQEEDSQVVTPGDQIRQEVEVYAYRHGDESSVEEVDTVSGGRVDDDEVYSEMDEVSVLYANADISEQTEGDQDVDNVDNEPRNLEMKSSVYASIPGENAQPPLPTYFTSVADETMHDVVSGGMRSPSVTGVVQEAQDESGEYHNTTAHPLANCSQVSTEVEMINNLLKHTSVINNQIQTASIQLGILPKNAGNFYEQPQAATNDSLEYSRLYPASQNAFYYTAVKDGLCKIQLAANHLVIVPFASGTVGEFCSMMNEDYNGLCCILCTGNCSFNKRIPLDKLKAPFIIQFGGSGNLVQGVEL